MERYCKDLKEHAPTIINNEQEEMIPLADEENKSYKKQKICYICKKDLVLMIITNIIKSEMIVSILEIIETLLVIFVI